VKKGVTPVNQTPVLWMIWFLPKKFENLADAALELTFDSGLSTAQNTQLVLSDRGTPIWRISKNASGSLAFLSENAGGKAVVILSSAVGVPASSIVVDAIGNVGIGTASPGNKLHVLGSARIEGSELRVDNNADADATFTVDSGQTSAFNSQIAFADRGFDQWVVRKDALNELFIQRVSDTPIMRFKAGNIIDLDTDFTKAGADPMDIHAHAARHGAGGADPISGVISQALRVADTTPVTLPSTGMAFVTALTLPFDFTGRSGNSTILLWAAVQFVTGTSAAPTPALFSGMTVRFLLDGVPLLSPETLGDHTYQFRDFNNVSTQRNTVNSQGLKFDVSAAPHILTLEARQVFDGTSAELETRHMIMLDLGIT